MRIDFDGIADFPDPGARMAHVALAPPPRAPMGRPPNRAGVTARRVVALCAAALYEGVLLWSFDKRGDLAAGPAGALLLEIAIPLGACALAFAAATANGKRGLGLGKVGLVAGTLLVPALFATLTLWAGPPDADSESFWPHALRCFLVTSLLGAGPLALAGWAFRRSFATAPTWRMAALAMGCAASAAASMSLLCSVGSPAHVLMGHGGAILAAGAVGALLGRRLGEA